MSDLFNQALLDMTDDEKRRVRDRMEGPPKPYPGFKVTFYFDQKENLASIEEVGSVPGIGEIVYIRNWELFRPGHHDEENRYNFSTRNQWRVKRVDWSLRISLSPKERLINPSNHYHAQVYLEQYESLRDRIRFGFMKLRYWPMRRCLARLRNLHETEGR